MIQCHRRCQRGMRDSMLQVTKGRKDWFCHSEVREVGEGQQGGLCFDAYRTAQAEMLVR